MKYHYIRDKHYEIQELQSLTDQLMKRHPFSQKN